MGVPQKRMAQRLAKKRAAHRLARRRKRRALRLRDSFFSEVPASEVAGLWERQMETLRAAFTAKERRMNE